MDAANSDVEASLAGMAGELTELRVRVDALTRKLGLDALTGIGSPWAFEEGLGRLTREADGVAADLCLLLADVDHLHQLNHRHGHRAGDLVLRAVAQEMSQCVRGRDLIARYGGVKLAVLLPATSYAGAMVVAESIRAIIEAQVVEREDGELLDGLTISLGVARYRSGEGASAFVERADACLARSKFHGRNRVTGEEDLWGD